VLEAFRVRLAGQPYLTFNPGVALGGTAVTLDAPHNQGSAAGKLNVVSRDVVVQGDLRTLSPEQLAQVQGTMREIVAQPLPHTHLRDRVRRRLSADGADRRQSPAARALRRDQPRPSASGR